MKLQWFHNASFEAMMADVDKFITANPNITAVHTDVKSVLDSSGYVYWYWSMLYKP